MFKDILTVYGKGVKTRQECQDYIADSHRSLVMSLPIFTKIYRYYSMRRVQDDPTLTELTPYRYDNEMLIISPHATESLDAWMAGMTDPEYLAKAKPDISTRTPSMYAPAGSEFDAIIETWVTDFNSLADLRDLVRTTYAPFVDSARSTSTLSIEHVAVDRDRSESEV